MFIRFEVLFIPSTSWSFTPKRMKKLRRLPLRLPRLLRFLKEEMKPQLFPTPWKKLRRKGFVFAGCAYTMTIHIYSCCIMLLYHVKLWNYKCRSGRAIAISTLANMLTCIKHCVFQ